MSWSRNQKPSCEVPSSPLSFRFCCVLQNVFSSVYFALTLSYAKSSKGCTEIGISNLIELSIAVHIQCMTWNLVYEGGRAFHSGACAMYGLKVGLRRRLDFAMFHARAFRFYRAWGELDEAKWKMEGRLISRRCAMRTGDLIRLDTAKMRPYSMLYLTN